MTKDTGPFLTRWSRLKRQGGETPDPVADAAPEAPPPAVGQPAEPPLPELPPIEELTPESDFRPFMDPRVPDALRRLALKKLYADPHFNVPDMLDDYAGDYNTLLETLPSGMAGKLAHARRTLLGQGEADRIEAAEEEAARIAAAEGDASQAAPAVKAPHTESESQRTAEAPGESSAPSPNPAPDPERSHTG